MNVWPSPSWSWSNVSRFVGKIHVNHQLKPVARVLSLASAPASVHGEKDSHLDPIPSSWTPLLPLLPLPSPLPSLLLFTKYSHALHSNKIKAILYKQSPGSLWCPSLYRKLLVVSTCPLPSCPTLCFTLTRLCHQISNWWNSWSHLIWSGSTWLLLAALPFLSV